MRWFLLLLLFDLGNLLSLVRRIVHVDDWLPESRDYTVLVPIYGSPRYLQNLNFLERIKPNVVIVVETSSDGMQSFADALAADGWRVHTVVCEQRPPGPPEMLLSALRRGVVTTEYVLRLDGDSYCDDPASIGQAVTCLARHGVDLSSVRVLPSKRETLFEKLQGVEYDISMLSRYYRPWLTSGACHIARTRVMRQCLEHHSGWFPGEDTEVGRVARHFCFKVEHCDLVVYTDVPESFRPWFRQRRAWWAGVFRHAIQNFDINLRYSLWIFYYVFLVWITLSGKWLSFVTAYEAVPLIVLAYTGVTFLASWQVRSRWMIPYVYYALFQVLVMPIVGTAFYLWLCVKRKKIGRYKIGLRRNPQVFSWRRGEFVSALERVENEDLPARLPEASAVRAR
jgi:cellulose synthase/poly-beta-1,6-N-acetylglucosamine synthase-like glycosyltransferase